MENQNNINEENQIEEKGNIWKKWVKRFGIGGLIFFTIKGIITTTLIIWAGKCAVG